MRRSSVLLTLFLLSPVATLGCSSDSGVYSPSEPEQFDLRMFDREGLAGYDPGERAYVMGHSIGVYLMGKTLPSYVAEKGYLYRPGHSSPHALVSYDWELVLVARSGGSNGSGGVLYDDVGLPPPAGGPEECDDLDPYDEEHYEECNEDPPGGGDEPPGGDGDPPGGDPPGGDGGDDVDPPGGDGTPPGGDGTPPGGGDPEIDDDCEAFLDPAGVHARELAARVDAERFFDASVVGQERAILISEFERGLAHALKVQDFNENVRYSEVEFLKDSVQSYGLCDYSPLVLDLDGDGVRLTSPAAGVRFDLQERGVTVRTAWTTGGDALLAQDLNGDGRISSGAELFGQSWSPAGGRFDDGFAALAELDRVERGGNADGRIDAADAGFAALRLWIDTDHDGVTDAGELVTLAAERITALPLAHERSDARDVFGNALRLVGGFEREGAGGTCERGTMIDAWFELRP